MTQYGNADAIVAGDPDSLRATAAKLDDLSGAFDRIASSIGEAVDTTDSGWTGPTADRFRDLGRRKAKPLTAATAPLETVAGALRVLAGEVTAAKKKAAEAMGKAERLGLPGGALGDSKATAAFVSSNPDKAPKLQELIGAASQAHADGTKAQDAYIATVKPANQQLNGHADEADPDGARGRRIESDERFRRDSEARSRDRGGDFDSDWAGRAILGRYLSGGDDWKINNDPEWNKYMKENETLRQSLMGPVQQQAQQALAGYLKDGTATNSFSQDMQMEIENGEGIIGYQYLHGTDKNAGGFDFKGDTEVKPRPDGNYEVTLNSQYTWNDKIDPNGQYRTDEIKSTIGEIMTFGQSDPYQMHITWPSQTKVVMNANGDVVEMKGYPAQ